MASNLKAFVEVDVTKVTYDKGHSSAGSCFITGINLRIRTHGVFLVEQDKFKKMLCFTVENFMRRIFNK